MIPKWLRRRNYEKLLIKAEQKDIFLCWGVKKHFPFLGIRYYPELWNNRDHASSTCLVPFKTHSERVDFLKNAIKLIKPNYDGN